MPNAAAAQNRQTIQPQTRAWLERLAEIGTQRGYFEALGPDHSAILTDRGPRLLVTFETIDTILEESEDDLPLGFDISAGSDWSQLCIVAHRPTWFRNGDLYAYFDRLVDDCFFDDFDQVVFYGAGMCGYGAAAYSVAAPGATVIALQPQATLDPRRAEWDTRFVSMRRTSFTDRYGYAPDMIEAAGRAFILYDPEEDLDAMHAALFAGPNVTRLRCRYLGHRIAPHLAAMDVLQPMIEAAMQGTLKPADFYRLYRARRNYSPWLRRVLAQLQDDDRLKLTGILCRNVLTRLSGPRFRRALKTAEAQLAEQGKALPPTAKTATPEDAPAPLQDVSA